MPAKGGMAWGLAWARTRKLGRIVRIGLAGRAALLLGLLLALLLRSDGRAQPEALTPQPWLDPALGPLDRRHLAVVINDADPLSVALGALYARERGIPEAQLIRLRFAPGRAAMTPKQFGRLHSELERLTPAHVQAYALAWTLPYRVGCQSITSAVASGLLPLDCARGCAATPINPYYARSDVGRPWTQLRLRPTMLLAARSLAAGRALIERGVAADGTAPGGTAYLLSSSDPVRNVRAAGYGQAAAVLGTRLRVRVLRQDRLEGARDVIVYLTGLAHVPVIDGNHYRPGAIADHLTSFGGALDGGNGQMSALRWLEVGATGSYGTVVEPCNLPAKFPDPALLISAYRDGATLIEAYWRSVAMPAQGVFIGEPLARPWPVPSAAR
jgi:uncharacterized protein (TIGR03790 family)